MSKLRAQLDAYRDEGTVVAWWRKEDPEERREGVLVALSKRVAVFQSVADSVHLDGYAALRLKSLASVAAKPNSALKLRVLAERGETPGVPAEIIGLPKLTIRSMLEALSGRVIVLHDRDPEVCWLGPPLVVGKEVRLDLLDTSGRPVGDRVVRRRDVTLIEWDTGYSEAIARMSTFAGEEDE
jgi:hypothetical protein